MIKRVKSVAQYEKIITIFGGDNTDGIGDKHKNNHHFGTHTDQKNMAVDFLRPLRDLSAECYGVIGTESHVGIGGEFDIAVYKELGIPYAQHWRIDIDGVLVDVAHHTTNLPKNRDMWEGALAQRANAINREYKDRGERQADIIIRQHIHRHAVGYGRNGCVMTTGLGWKLRDPYVAKFDALGLYSVGCLLIEPRTRKVNPIKYEGTEDEITKSKVTERE